VGRDLHLDLREVVRPGARGVRDLLIIALRDAVRSGRLPVDTVLPPSPSLAADLGLAHNTVAEAYAELVAEGWLASRQGSGTWVVNAGRQAQPVRPRGTAGLPTHNLMPGSPDVSAFPRSQWLASARRALLTSTPMVCRWTPHGAPRYWPGPGGRAATCSRTTTTASSATTGNPSARCKASIPTASHTLARSAKPCRRCSGLDGASRRSRRRRDQRRRRAAVLRQRN
jgi:hypothetical protein